jgi:hypothetical protein
MSVLQFPSSVAHPPASLTGIIGNTPLVPVLGFHAKLEMGR